MSISINKFRVLVLFGASILSILTWWLSEKIGYSLLYNDAMAHLNLSRIVFDNLKPGITQLGGVWLPLNQILYLPLIWNDWAWHSGFAGSLISMICYIFSVYTIFESIYFVSKNKIAGLVGALVFAINVNILYLQSTSLTEPLFLFLFILSFFYFFRWVVDKKPSHLIVVALLGFPLVLSRYDGWFVMIMEMVIVMLYEFFYQKKNLFTTIGIGIVFSLPFLYGIFLWLFWNKLIFGSFLFFALGPYSAHAQQAVIAKGSEGLLAKGNLWYAILSYFYTIKDNIGLYIILLTLISSIIFFLRKNKLTLLRKIIILSFLISPVIFNTLALYFGFSTVNVPELHWKPTFDQSGTWFNVRYGILALPIAAIIIGFAVSKTKSKVFALLAISLIIFQSYVFLMVDRNVVTITEGLSGSSKFQYPDVSNYLKTHVKPNDKVLLSLSYFSPVAFKSGIKMDQVIHEGTGNYWAQSLNYPFKYPNWIVMSNGNIGDPVYGTLVNKQRNSFLAFYKLIYRGKNANIYERRAENEVFVRRDKTKLIAGTDPVIIIGVNSYDLAYRTNEQIKENFAYFKKMKINTLRFWAFGDGISNGFQPQAGITNEERFKHMDYILALAKENSIHVIPVLVNNWSDYGGKAQYVQWIGQNTDDLFYTDKNAKGLFKNYVNKIVSRKNTFNGVLYANDPTIFAWEIMNEPRSGQSNMTSSAMLKSWADEMGTYLKSIDSNHLISIGTENTSLCTLNTIDLCSVHLYVENQGIPKYSSLTAVNDFLSKEEETAKQLQKPVYVGELGIRKEYKTYDQDPLNLFNTLTLAIDQKKYSGYIIWNWSLKEDASFGFSPDGMNGVYSLTDITSVLNRKAHITAQK